MKFLYGIFFILSAFIFTACSNKLEIVKNPISFSKERKMLTAEYMKEHYGMDDSNIVIVPKIIVLHWTAINSYDASFRVFNMEKLNGSRPDLSGAGQVNVGIQYLVDRDGTVHQLMPDTLMARHCIGLNYCSIGVENVGGGNDIDNLTDEQIEANIKLVKYLVKKYPTLEYLIGHLEYRYFEGHPLWKEIDPNYRTPKSDPGERFMNAVREGVREFQLKGLKEIEEEKVSQPL